MAFSMANFLFFFSVMLFCSLSNPTLEAAKSTKQAETNTKSFADVLLEIESQLQDTTYSEKLYLFKTKVGAHRLLIVNNPERKMITVGNLSSNQRIFFGCDRPLPDEYINQIDQIFDELEIQRGDYSGASFNGKTIFQLFGY